MLLNDLLNFNHVYTKIIMGKNVPEGVYFTPFDILMLFPEGF